MYKCDQCDKSFPNAHGLKVHKSRMHSKTNQHESSQKVNLENANLHTINLRDADLRTKITKPKPQKTEKVVNFCPNCGCNILSVQMALNI